LLILMGSLVAACDANSTTSTDEPASVVAPTEPEAEVVITEDLPADEPTDEPSIEPAPLDQAALLASLADHPVLNADNIESLRFLGQFNLAAEPISFELWAWSQDGRRVALWYPGEDSRYEIHDLEDAGRVTTIDILDPPEFEARIGYVDSLVFSRDGELLAAPLLQRFAIYHAATGELVSELDIEYTQNLEQAVFSSQGTRLAVSYQYRMAPEAARQAYDVIYLFEVETGGSFGTFFNRNLWFISDLEYSTEGNYLVAASRIGVEAWHAEGGQLPLVDCSNAEVTFSPVREEAALSCRPRDSALSWEQLIWDLATGDLTPLGGEPDNRVLDLRYSPDGTLVAGMTESGEILVWDVASGQLLSTLDISLESPLDLAFVHDGRALAVLNEFGSISFYGIP
jgi:WD40 repeat protein